MISLRMEGGALGQPTITVNHFSGYVVATD